MNVLQKLFHFKHQWETISKGFKHEYHYNDQVKIVYTIQRCKACGEHEAYKQTPTGKYQMTLQSALKLTTHADFHKL